MSERAEVVEDVSMDALTAIRDAAKYRLDGLKLTEGWRVLLPWRALRAHIMYAKAEALEDVAKTLALSVWLTERARVRISQ